MEEFLPSEIARLVLGYLEETKCRRTWRMFIEENSSLAEYFHLYQKGKVYTTNVNGMSLTEILGKYCFLQKEIIEKKEKMERQKNDDLENNITKDGVMKILKSAMEQVFQQYFPSLSNNSSHSAPENVTNTPPDSMGIIATKIQKNKLVNVSVKDLNHICIDNSEERDISYGTEKSKMVDENVKDLNSISVDSHKEIDIKLNENEIVNINFKDLNEVLVNNTKQANSNDINIDNNNERDTLNATDKTVRSCTYPQITEVTSLNNTLSCEQVRHLNSKDSCTSSNVSSVHLIDVIKIDDDDYDDDDDIYEDISSTQNKNIDICNSIIQCKDSELAVSCNVSEEIVKNKSSVSETSTLVPNIALSNIQENTNSSIASVVTSKLEYLNDSKNNLDNDTSPVCGTGSFRNSCDDNLLLQNNVALSYPSVCDDNLEVGQNPSLSNQGLVVQGNKVINTSISSTNHSAYVITPNHCSTVPISNGPNYILQNYTGGCFVQKNSPYQIIINSNRIPLTGIPLNNAPNPIFAANNSSNITGIPLLFEHVSEDKVPSSTSVVTDDKETDAEADVVNEKGSARRKNEKELSESKKNNSSEAKYGTKKRKKKTQPKKLPNKRLRKH